MGIRLCKNHAHLQDPCSGSSQSSADICMRSADKIWWPNFIVEKLKFHDLSESPGLVEELRHQLGTSDFIIKTILLLMSNINYTLTACQALFEMLCGAATLNPQSNPIICNPVLQKGKTVAQGVKVMCYVVKIGFASHVLAMLLIKTLLLPHPAETLPSSIVSCILFFKPHLFSVLSLGE